MNSNDYNQLYDNAWTLNYLYPEKFGGAKIPDPHPVPSNTTTLTTDRIIKPNNKSALVYFSPLIETTAPYFFGYTVNTSLPAGNLSDYIVYADSNSAPIPVDSKNILSLESWSYKQQPSLGKLSAYKRLRVVGACMEINVMDKVEDYSGIIETCMGIEVIGNGLKNDNIDTSRMCNHPNYRVFKTNEPIILKYRYNHEKYTAYGPYEPFSMVPFHLARFSSMSDTASIRIKTTIHIEGMLMPSLTHFATKGLRVQYPKHFQQALHQEMHAETAATTKAESDQHFTDSEYVPESLKTSNTFDSYANYARPDAGKTGPRVNIPEQPTEAPKTRNSKKNDTFKGDQPNPNVGEPKIKPEEPKYKPQYAKYDATAFPSTYVRFEEPNLEKRNYYDDIPIKTYKEPESSNFSINSILQHMPTLNTIINAAKEITSSVGSGDLPVLSGADVFPGIESRSSKTTTTNKAPMLTITETANTTNKPSSLVKNDILAIESDPNQTPETLEGYAAKSKGARPRFISKNRSDQSTASQEDELAETYNTEKILDKAEYDDVTKYSKKQYLFDKDGYAIDEEMSTLINSNGLVGSA